MKAEFHAGSQLRADDAVRLERAAGMLGVVNIKSPRPVQAIDAALGMLNEAFASVTTYGTGSMCKELRVNILRVKGVRAALASNEPVGRDDYALVYKAARGLEATAAEIRQRNEHAASPETRQQSPHLSTSVTGQRFGLNPELAAGHLVRNGRPIRAVAIDAVEEDWANHEDMRSRMPARIAAGASYAVTRAPVLVFTKNYMGDTALNRSGLRWRRVGDNTGGRQPGLSMRTGGGSQMHGVILENQVLVGFPREVASDAKLRAAATSRATEALEGRLGSLVAPMSVRGALLVSPGNPLSWLWLMPARVMSATHMAPVSASFPWRADNVRLSERDRQAAEQEVKRLDANTTKLLNDGRGVDVRDLTRQSQLMERLDRDRSAGGGDKDFLAQLRAMADAEVTRLTARLRLERDHLQEELELLGKPTAGSMIATEARRARAAIKTVDDKIAATKARVYADFKSRRAEIEAQLKGRE